MTFKTRQNPETQIWNTETYLDNLTTGSGLESPAAADQNGQFDLNALRTMLRNHLGTSRKWYNAPQDSFGLDAIHDKKLAYDTGVRPGTSDFTLASTASGYLVTAAMLPSTTPLAAVGASSTTDGGYIVADEANFTVAGTLGVGLSTVVDAAGILLNRCSIVDDSTNAPVKTVDDEEIFGLLQCVTGTSDGATVTGSGSEIIQISFVYIDKDTDTITATTLPAADYHFATRRISSFYSAPVGLVIGGAGLPEIVDPTQSLLKVPFREIDITGTGPAANDPMTITTGTFTTAGAQTVAASYGTPALPSSGADFRDDPRIKVYANGIKLSKGVDAAANRDVYLVSTTQIAFEEKLKSGRDIIYIEAPASY